MDTQGTDKTLLIKGNVKDAILSANLHGVKLGVIHKLCECHEEIAAGTRASEEALNKWFCEDVGKGPSVPGSLLFWAPAGEAEGQLVALLDTHGEVN